MAMAPLSTTPIDAAQIAAAVQGMIAAGKAQLIDDQAAFCRLVQAQLAASQNSLSLERAIDRVYMVYIYRAAAAGDGRAFSELSAQAKAQARVLANSADEADEILQEACTLLVENIAAGKIRAPEALKWYFGTLVKTAGRTVRGRRPLVPLPISPETGEPIELPDPQAMSETVEEQLNEATLKSAVEAALPDPLQRAICNYKLQDPTIKAEEIAIRLKMPVTKIYAETSKMRKILRNDQQFLAFLKRFSDEA